MSYIDPNPLQHSTIQSIHSEWDTIVKDPPYQRNGDVWSLEKKQLLIDSIINRYDIPKIYFHKYDRQETRKTGKVYAIIDGRQRLEAIMGFVADEFTLGKDFEYLEDPSVQAAEMNYSELAQKYPKVKSRFDSFSLPIITVQTDDLELIEDMFSRLNEAVPLNAAEKRRSIGGEMVRAIDDISNHAFFKKKVKFSNKRYQHKEVAVRLLFLAYHRKRDQVVDTKKPFLDSFTRELRSGKTAEVQALKKEISGILDGLAKVFINADPLLIAQASVPVYAFVYQRLGGDGESDRFTRTKLEKFNNRRTQNRKRAENDIARANFDLLEYDRLSLQGTNDASSLRERWRILEKWLRTN